MPQKATNAVVSNINVKVQRPKDRARKQNEMGGGSHQAAVEITGTGGSGTLIENNSSGAWYLERATTSVEENVGIGPLSVTFEVKDANGGVVTAATGDLVLGDVNFEGVPVLSGWTVDYTILQSDSETYNVLLYPIVRQPDPTTGESLDPGQVNETSIIDGFEDGNIDEYSGDTDAFTVAQDQTFKRSNSLKATGSDGAWVESVSGLETYPTSENVFVGYVRTSAIGGDAPHNQMMYWGADGNGSGIGVWLDWGRYDNVHLVEVDDGAVASTITMDNNVAGNWAADQWYKIVVDRPEKRVRIVDVPTGDNVSTLSYATRSYESGGGVGYVSHALADGETYWWDGLEVVG